MSNLLKIICAQKSLWVLSFGLIAVPSVKAAGIVANATGPTSTYSYSSISINGRTSTGPAGVTLIYAWRQIKGSAVTIFTPTGIGTAVVTRTAGTLAFELKVQDKAKTLKPGLDTIQITVVEPTKSSQYLDVLQAGFSVQDGPSRMAVTTGSGEPSFSSSSSSLSLSGTATNEGGTFGIINWYNGTVTGAFTPTNVDWTGLKIPLLAGDNWITLVYNKSGKVSVEKRLVTWTTGVSFGSLSMSPDEFTVGVSSSHQASISVAATGLSMVNLVLIGNSETAVGQMLDDGGIPDVHAGDGIFSLGFNRTPVSSDKFRFRAKATVNGKIYYSPAFLFSTTQPFSDVVFNAIKSTNSQAVANYTTWKAQLGKSQALTNVVAWLGMQSNVAMAGINQGDNNVCWQYTSGVHAVLNDAPLGTKGNGFNMIKTKGLSPFQWDFGSSDDGIMTYKEILYKRNPVAYVVDSLLENTNSIQNNVSIEDWKSWGGYKTIVISSHGGTFGYKSLSQIRYNPTIDQGPNGTTYFLNPFQMVYTGVDITPIVNKYWKDLTSSTRYPNMVLDASNTVWLTPSFFKKYDKGMTGSFVYMSSCRSLYNDGFWNAFKGNGVAAMVGYSDYVAADFAGNSGQIIFTKLTQGLKLQDGINAVVNFCTNSGQTLCAVLGGKAHDMNPTSPAYLNVRGKTDFALIPTQVWTWGNNWAGQLGKGTIDPNLPNPANFLPMKVLDKPSLKISLGGLYCLLMAADSTVWSWGNNFAGELGLGDTTIRTTPVQITSLGKAIDIAAGQDFNVALMPDSTLRTWGGNESGALGNGKIGWDEFETNPISPTPGKFIGIAASGQTALAIATDSSVWGWGDNTGGQLTGGPSDLSFLHPTQLPGLDHVVSVACGLGTSYALRKDGTLWAWGSNFAGSIGDGSGQDQASPVQIMTNVKVISASRSPAAIKTDGSVWTWGDGIERGGVYSRLVPTNIGGLKNGVSVAGGGIFGLAVTADGKTWGWGRQNDQGQQGNGSSLLNNWSPLQTKNLTSAKQVSSGTNFGAALQ